MDEETTPGSHGPAVDRLGREVFDPTKNVLDLVDQAIRRQDDLREADRSNLAAMEQMRAEASRNERVHLREIQEIRAAYDDKLRDAESKRIDAIRSVDVGAVAAAAQVQATQATTLAAQVATSAETLRNQVAAAATAQTVALAAALEPIIKDIADLRRAQYEAQGQKAQVVERQASSGVVIGVIGAAVALVLLALALYAFTRPAAAALGVLLT